MTEITTAEELDALPDGTRVRDRDGDVWEHWGGEWHTRETRPFDSAWLFRKWAPLTVLPDAPAPAAEDREAEFAWHEAHGPVIPIIGDERYMPVTVARRLAARQPAPVDTRPELPGEVVDVIEMTRTPGGLVAEYLHVMVETRVEHRPERGPVVLREVSRG